MSVLLQVENLETAYGASQVLFGLDLAIGAGEVATLLGRNGMGKTTTVRSIMGLTPARSGVVRFRGERIERQRPDRIARCGIALVPEGRQIFPNLSVREEIWRCLAALKAAGQTILVIDKYVERLIAIADHHTILSRGRVAWRGSSAELGADRSLWHRHLGV